MSDKERELLLLVSSLIGGDADGTEFLTIDDALAALRPLENPGDQRLLLGQSRLWQRLAEQEAAMHDADNELGETVTGLKDALEEHLDDHPPEAGVPSLPAPFNARIIPTEE